MSSLSISARWKCALSTVDEIAKNIPVGGTALTPYVAPMVLSLVFRTPFLATVARGAVLSARESLEKADFVERVTGMRQLFADLMKTRKEEVGNLRYNRLSVIVLSSSLALHGLRTRRASYAFSPWSWVV